ncbi:MAG: hypothetical protein ABEL51_02760 [Salinibacter sp.]
MLVALVSVLFVLGACDSGGANGGDVKNEFSLDITPSSSASGSFAAKAGRDTTINGFSFFYSGQNPNGKNVFGLYLSGNESFSPQSVQDGLYGFLARNSTRPSSGQYNLVGLKQGLDSGNFIGVLYEDFGRAYQDAPFYVPRSGTVRLDTSSPDKVTGSIDLTAYAITFNTAAGTVDSTLVDITGTFTAKNVEDFAPLQTPSN